MTNATSRIFAAAAAVFLFAACEPGAGSGSGGPLCQPGVAAPCACPGGGQGQATCSAQGLPGACEGCAAADVGGDTLADVAGPADVDEPDTIAPPDTKGPDVVGTDLGAPDEGPDAVACVPDCAGRECGDDGCGGVCGSCPAAAPICDDGLCAVSCQPACAGKQCGPDGCGGTCGACTGEATCDAAGVCQPPVCSPQCGGKECGDDGCGGACGACPGGYACDAAFQCVSTCAPSCVGKQCGDDGCGGSCGACSGGSSCAAGQCVTENPLPATVNLEILGVLVGPAKASGEAWDGGGFISQATLNAVFEAMIGDSPYSDVLSVMTSAGIAALAMPDPMGVAEIDVGNGFETPTSLAVAANNTENTFAPTWPAPPPPGWIQAPVSPQLRVRITLEDEDVVFHDAIGTAVLTYDHILATWNKGGAAHIAVDDQTDGQLLFVTLAVKPGCTPQCQGKACGDNGCGGECSKCPSGTACNGVQCVAASCGAIGFEGCCQSGDLYWCEGGQLIGLACHKNPSCGWSAQGYYDCGTDGASDPSNTFPKSCP